MTQTLAAQAETAAAHTALFVDMVKSGGPFAIALVLVVVLGLAVYKIAGKPTLDSLASISANFAKASNDLERITNRAENAVTKAEGLVSQMEDRR